MTDEDVEELLKRLSTRKVKALQDGELPSVDAQLTTEIKSSLCSLLWYVGAKYSEQELITAGATQDQVATAMTNYKTLLQIIEESDSAEIPDELAESIKKDLREALLEEPADTRSRLDEKVAAWIKEYRIEIYLNESQHRGRPHVAVVLPDGKISVSLDDPPVVLTPNGLRGEAAALKVVEKHREQLRKLWDDTRPDDQKLPSR